MDPPAVAVAPLNVAESVNAVPSGAPVGGGALAVVTMVGRIRIDDRRSRRFAATVGVSSSRVRQIARVACDPDVGAGHVGVNCRRHRRPQTRAPDQSERVDEKIEVAAQSASFGPYQVERHRAAGRSARGRRVDHRGPRLVRRRTHGRRVVELGAERHAAAPPLPAAIVATPGITGLTWKHSVAADSVTLGTPAGLIAVNSARQRYLPADVMVAAAERIGEAVALLTGFPAAGRIGPVPPAEQVAGLPAVGARSAGPHRKKFRLPLQVVGPVMVSTAESLTWIEPAEVIERPPAGMEAPAESLGVVTSRRVAGLEAAADEVLELESTDGEVRVSARKLAKHSSSSSRKARSMPPS